MGRDPKERDIYGEASDALIGFGKVIDDLWSEDYVLLGFSVRMPRSDGDEFFMVVRASKDGKRFVAFRSADHLSELLVGLKRAAHHRTLKFREDRYAESDD